MLLFDLGWLLWLVWLLGRVGPGNNFPANAFREFVVFFVSWVFPVSLDPLGLFWPFFVLERRTQPNGGQLESLIGEYHRAVFLSLVTQAVDAEGTEVQVER